MFEREDRGQQRPAEGSTERDRNTAKGGWIMKMKEKGKQVL